LTSSTLEFDVTGMTCGSCAARVERILARQPGVAAAAVTLATGRGTVELEPRGAAPEPDLVSAVEHLGYGFAPHRADQPRDPSVGARWGARLAVGAPLG